MSDDGRWQCISLLFHNDLARFAVTILNDIHAALRLSESHAIDVIDGLLDGICPDGADLCCRIIRLNQREACGTHHVASTCETFSF